MKKILLLCIGLFFVTGCSKEEGTWCVRTQIYSDLVICNHDISDKDFSALEKKVQSFKGVTSYDVMTDIENGNPTITIFFKDEDTMHTAYEALEDAKYLDSVEEKAFIVTQEKLVLKKESYTYGTSLHTIQSNEKVGSYTVKDDMVILDDQSVFYLKDSFLCKDKDCELILTKGKKNSCE